MKSVRHTVALALIAALTAALAATAPSAASAAAAGSACSTMPLSGHRGGAGSAATENTVGAFMKGISAGAARVELDVRLTSDKRLVVMHDATVDRTTHGTGAVAAMTVAKFRALRANDGQPVPTVADALAAIAPTSAGLYLHLKAMGGSDSYNRLAQLIRDAGMAQRVFVGGFPTDMQAPFYKVAPAMSRWLVTHHPPTAGEAKAAGLDTVSTYPKKVTAARVRHYRLRGVELTSGSNAPAVWSRLLQLHVRGISVDDVAAYQTWCAGGSVTRTRGAGMG